MKSRGDAGMSERQSALVNRVEKNALPAPEQDRAVVRHPEIEPGVETPIGQLFVSAEGDIAVLSPEGLAMAAVMARRATSGRGPGERPASKP